MIFIERCFHYKMKLHIYLHKNGACLAVRGKQKPRRSNRLYVVYELTEAKGFTMPPFPEISYHILERDCVYVGSVSEKNGKVSIY